MCRFLAGMGLAGTYMPGLKVLSDHTEGRLQSRYMAFYTSSFSVGAAASRIFVRRDGGDCRLAMELRPRFGRIAGRGLMIATMVPAGNAQMPRAGTEPGSFSTFGPSEARPAMAYIIAYTAHVWELFSMRAWIVAFLAFSQSLQTPGSVGSVTRIAAIVNLLGLPASLGGNELARRFGRRRVVRD